MTQSRGRTLKIAFATFGALVALSVVGGVQYLESQRFADTVKKMISKRSDRNLGIVGDFSNLELHLFPPGLGVANPSIHIDKENISKLPIEGEIDAKEMRVSFAPLQMLSGTIQISEVLVREGSVQGKIGADIFRTTKKPKTPKLTLRWQDLFKLQINGVRFEDTYLNVHSELPRNGGEPIDAECVVKHLQLQKQQRGNRSVFTSDAMVNAVKINLPKDLVNLPIKESSQVEWNLELSDQGLKLDPFYADLGGLELKLTGKITGNLLDNQSALKLSGDVSATSDLGFFFAQHTDDHGWSGAAAATAKFEAALNDFEHSFKGSYQVSAQNVVWKDIHLNSLQGDGDVDLAHQKIDVKNLVAEDSSDPAHVGTFKLQNTSLPLQMNEPFQAKLSLSQADLHWLGGAVLADIYALEGRLNGDVQVMFTPGSKKTWRLKAVTDLKVDDFALTNQTMREKRAKTFILKPKFPVQARGDVLVTPTGVDFKDYSVKLQKTQLAVTGGVHSKTGFELSGKGPVELTEFGKIAENSVAGSGSLVVGVHGPVERVLLDFDTDAENTMYMDLKFGKVKGRITYDDGLRQLRFTQVHARQNNTFYSLPEGFIELGDKDDMHLPFEIHSGRVEDLSFMLEPLVKKVSWFPTALTGDLHGDVDLSGKLSTAKMVITSNLEGSDWQWYGERARSIKFNFGYDHGLYYLHNGFMVKTNGEVRGDVEFDSRTDEMKWNLATNGMSLTDLDVIDRLEIPVKGRLELKSYGSGKLDRLKSRTEGRMYSTELKGEALEPSVFTLEMNENTMRANLDVFGTTFHSQLKYALTPKQPSSFEMNFNHFDFSPALLMVNPKLLDDPSVKGSITGRAHLDFLTGQGELARGEIQINDYRLEKTGASLVLIDPVMLPVQLGYFNLSPVRLRFKNSELKLQGEGRKGNLDLQLTGTLDLAMAELFSSSLQKVTGKAQTDIRVSGPFKELVVNGDLNFSGAYALMRWLQTPFEEMDGTIHIRKGSIYVDDLEAYLGDEIFSLNGKIETFANRFPALDLRGQFDDNKVKMQPLELVQARGIATIKGTQPPYVIGGNIEVPQALWTKSFGGSSAVGARGERFAPKNKDSQASSTLFVLDLNVNAPQGFVVKNEIVDAEFKGKVKLVGPPENPKLLGEGQLIQGKVLFRDHPFNLETLKIEFDDPYQMNPKFNALAVSEVNQYKIRVLAYGRANAWKVDFSSAPFLPENEIYSLLASGLTSSDSSRYRNRDRTFVNQGEAASLILHSMDFSRDVQTKTGFQFDVEEAIDTQTANSIFRPQAQGENIAAPKVVLKRKVGQNVALSFGSTVGVGSQLQREVNAEYSLTRAMSLLGVWTNIEETDTRDTRISYGLDLKFNKKFK